MRIITPPQTLPTIPQSGLCCAPIRWWVRRVAPSGFRPPTARSPMIGVHLLPLGTDKQQINYFRYRARRTSRFSARSSHRLEQLLVIERHAPVHVTWSIVAELPLASAYSSKRADCWSNTNVGPNLLMPQRRKGSANEPRDRVVADARLGRVLNYWIPKRCAK
jgi:hypothetical protein